MVPNIYFSSYMYLPSANKLRMLCCTVVETLHCVYVVLLLFSSSAAYSSYYLHICVLHMGIVHTTATPAICAHSLYMQRLQ